jgi:hypothetical protein
MSILMIGHHAADVHNGTPLASFEEAFPPSGVQSAMANLSQATKGLIERGGA